MDIKNIQVNYEKLKELKYEFVVFYKDGNSLYQNYNTPDEKNFNDIDLPNVKELWLEDKAGNRPFGLEPGTGSIIIKGAKFRVIFPKSQSNPNEPTEYRIMCYRKVRQLFGGATGVFLWRYCIGYQTTVDGKNYRQLIYFDDDANIELAQTK